MSEIVITAGGTREKIDDVRYVGNCSSGRLGHEIAKRYAELPDHRVTLIAPNETMRRYGEIEGVRHEPFVTARDLRESLLGVKAADVVYHSAAVADYTPVFQAGKIPSDQDELVVRMRRVPKILADLREHFGKQTTIVGFKLLSNAWDYDLERAAKEQIDACGIDFCVANDLNDVRADYRKILLVRKAVGLAFMGAPVQHYTQDYEGSVESTVGFIQDTVDSKLLFENRELVQENWY